MIASARAENSPLKFIAFVYVLSIPFWIVGALTESATTSTKVFTYREKGPGGAKALLARYLSTSEFAIMTSPGTAFR
jgi:hypothetical protein